MRLSGFGIDTAPGNHFLAVSEAKTHESKTDALLESRR